MGFVNTLATLCMKMAITWDFTILALEQISMPMKAVRDGTISSFFCWVDKVFGGY
jgi:hypothetical protein